MKRLILATLTICATLAVCAPPTSALALDLSGFGAKVEKHASSDGKVRGLCVCKQVGIYYLRAGFLTAVPQPVGSGTLLGISVTCSVPVFYSGGGVSQIGSCSSFEVLGGK